MLITMVSFVSLASTMSAAGVSGSMLTDMNVLQNEKDRDRCSFVNGNWSSYCECKMNSDDPNTRKVGRISGKSSNLYLHSKTRNVYRVTQKILPRHFLIRIARDIFLCEF